MTQQTRAVLWDMDGTLLDSADYHWLAWREILAGERFELAHHQFVATFGQRNDTILRGFFGDESDRAPREASPPTFAWRNGRGAQSR